MRSISLLLALCVLAGIVLATCPGCDKPEVLAIQAMRAVWTVWIEPTFVSPAIAEIERRATIEGYVVLGEWRFQSSEFDEVLVFVAKQIDDMRHGNGVSATEFKETMEKELPEYPVRDLAEAFGVQ